MKSPERRVGPSRQYLPVDKELPVKKEIESHWDLLASDLEGILAIGKSNIWERLFVKKGIQDEHARLKKEYLVKLEEAPLNKKLDIRLEWVSRECDALVKAGLTKDEFDEIVNSQPLAEDAREVFAILRKRRYPTGILTGGIKALAERVQREFGIDEVWALCDFIFNDQGILERCEFLPCDYEGKADFLRQLARDLNVPMERTFYVGHGPNDVNAFEAADGSAAFSEFSRIKGVKGYDIVISKMEDLLIYFPPKDNR